MTSEKFLITGGQGFVGAWLARVLLEEGTPVVVLDRTPDNHILSQILEPDSLPEIDRVFCDVTDTEKLRRTLEEEEITHIVHLADTQIPGCRQHPVDGATTNVVGTLSVFEAAHSLLDQIQMIVYASSAAVAGGSDDYDGAVQDSDHHRPATHYGVFKLANEGNARVYWNDHGVASVGLRPYATYGVGRELGVTSAPTKAIKAAVLGREYTIPFTGPLSFVFVEDLARLFVAAARSAAEGAPALNIRGSLETVERFVEILGEVFPELGDRIEVRGDPLPIAADFDESGLAELIGAENIHCTPLRRGVERVREHFERLGRAGRLLDRDL